MRNVVHGKVLTGFTTWRVKNKLPAGQKWNFDICKCVTWCCFNNQQTKETESEAFPCRASYIITLMFSSVLLNSPYEKTKWIFVDNLDWTVLRLCIGDLWTLISVSQLSQGYNKGELLNYNMIFKHVLTEVGSFVAQTFKNY